MEYRAVFKAETQARICFYCIASLCHRIRVKLGALIDFLELVVPRLLEIPFDDAGNHGVKPMHIFELSSSGTILTPSMFYNGHLKFQTVVSLGIPLYGSRNLAYISCKTDYRCPL